MAERDEFFEVMGAQRLALTFDDVRVQTGHCNFKPGEIDLKTRFTRNVGLNRPIISAAMDTVTESAMAIAMAKLGGIGVIHFNLKAQTQGREARRVWHYLNGLIERPITVDESQTKEEILRMRDTRRWTFHTFPVLGEEKRLVGLVTRNDFDFCLDQRLPVERFMTPASELVTAKAGTSLEEAFEIMTTQKKKVLVLVDANFQVAGMYVFSDAKRILMDSKTGEASYYNLTEDGHLRCFAAVGLYDDALERIEACSRYISGVLINKAHADFPDYLETVRLIKRLRPDLDVACGNISEGPSAKRLADAGADGILVGQGGGSICTTRRVAGIGKPQVTAVHDCERATRGSGTIITSDGGIRYSGDILIALAAGAKAVMLGNAIAGTTETPGDLIPHVFAVKGPNGQIVQQVVQVKIYRGMGSVEAMADASGSPSRYTDTGAALPVPEGVNSVVPYKGDLAKVAHYLIGGLMKGMAYAGTRTIPDLNERGDFHRITNAGLSESDPHDVTLLNEPPNWRRSGQ